MNIRNMKSEDIPYLCAIDNGAFKDPWSTAFFEDEIKKDYAYCCVLENEQGLCGYAVIWNIYETSELIRIAVDTKYQKQGYGSILMDNVINTAEKANCEKMMLEVRASNISAQALYRKYGFTQIAVRKKYYNGVEDAVIMEREIKV